LDGFDVTQMSQPTVTLTRRTAITNGTWVSFCNQPKAQFGYLKRV